MKLLHIDSSLMGAQSVSRQLSQAIMQAWCAADPTLRVAYRDLATTQPPQLTGAVVRAMKFQDKAAASEAAGDMGFMEELLTEFLEADAIVIGAPMYNFSLPTQLKAWLDALAQPGRTFAYTPEGPRGLAGAKRVVIASSRGGIYSKLPTKSKDFQEPYLVAVLNFMGITKIDIVRAEGVNLGAAQREDALRQAHDQIRTLFAQAELVG